MSIKSQNFYRKALPDDYLPQLVEICGAARLHWYDVLNAIAPLIEAKGYALLLEPYHPCVTGEFVIVHCVPRADAKDKQKEIDQRQAEMVAEFNNKYSVTNSRARFKELVNAAKPLNH